MRGGARLRDYHSHARRMTAPDYVVAVVHGQIVDHTLTFHLHEQFHIMAVIPHYLSDDSETLGYAALVEWLNPETDPARALRRAADALPAPRRRAAATIRRAERTDACVQEVWRGCSAPR